MLGIHLPHLVKQSISPNIFDFDLNFADSLVVQFVYSNELISKVKIVRVVAVLGYIVAQVLGIMDPIFANNWGVFYPILSLLGLMVCWRYRDYVRYEVLCKPIDEVNNEWQSSVKLDYLKVLIDTSDQESTNLVASLFNLHKKSCINVDCRCKIKQGLINYRWEYQGVEKPDSEQVKTIFRYFLLQLAYDNVSRFTQQIGPSLLYISGLSLVNLFPKMFSEIRRVTFKFKYSMNTTETNMIRFIKDDCLQLIEASNKIRNVVRIQEIVNSDNLSTNLRSLVIKVCENKIKMWYSLNNPIVDLVELKEYCSKELNFRNQIQKDFRTLLKMKHLRYDSWKLMMTYSRLIVQDTALQMSVVKSLDSVPKEVSYTILNRICESNQAVELLLDPKTCLVRVSTLSSNLGQITWHSKNIFDVFKYPETKKIIGQNVNCLIPSVFRASHQTVLQSWVDNPSIRLFNKINPVMMQTHFQWCYRAFLYLKIVPVDDGYQVYSLVHKIQTYEYLVLNEFFLVTSKLGFMFELSKTYDFPDTLHLGLLCQQALEYLVDPDHLSQTVTNKIPAFFNIPIFPSYGSVLNEFSSEWRSLSATTSRSQKINLIKKYHHLLRKDGEPKQHIQLETYVEKIGFGKLHLLSLRYVNHQLIDATDDKYIWTSFINKMIVTQTSDNADVVSGFQGSAEGDNVIDVKEDQDSIRTGNYSTVSSVSLITNKIRNIVSNTNDLWAVKTVIWFLTILLVWLLLLIGSSFVFTSEIQSSVDSQISVFQDVDRLLLASEKAIHVYQVYDIQRNSQKNYSSQQAVLLQQVDYLVSHLSQSAQNKTNILRERASSFGISTILTELMDAKVNLIINEIQNPMTMLGVVEKVVFVCRNISSNIKAQFPTQLMEPDVFFLAHNLQRLSDYLQRLFQICNNRTELLIYYMLLSVIALVIVSVLLGIGTVVIPNVYLRQISNNQFELLTLFTKIPLVIAELFEAYFEECLEDFDEFLLIEEELKRVEETPPSDLKTSVPKANRPVAYYNTTLFVLLIVVSGQCFQAYMINNFTIPTKDILTIIKNSLHAETNLLYDFLVFRSYNYWDLPQSPLVDDYRSRITRKPPEILQLSNKIIRHFNSYDPGNAASLKEILVYGVCEQVSVSDPWQCPQVLASGILLTTKLMMRTFQEYQSNIDSHGSSYVDFQNAELLDELEAALFPIHQYTNNLDGLLNKQLLKYINNLKDVSFKILGWSIAETIVVMVVAVYFLKQNSKNAKNHYQYLLVIPQSQLRQNMHIMGYLEKHKSEWKFNMQELGS